MKRFYEILAGIRIAILINVSFFAVTYLDHVFWH